MASNLEPKWRRFERLVAAIHWAADHGAKVQWNEVIGARQFDVAVRFKRGLYDYLTVIECKDRDRPVSIDQVDAFATKSKDAGAQLAVIASVSGFQSGAIEVAKRHNIELILVDESGPIDFAAFGARLVGSTTITQISGVTLEYRDGGKKVLPEAHNALTWYVSHIILRCKEDRSSVEQILAPEIEKLHLASEEPASLVVRLDPDTIVIEPEHDEIPLAEIARISATVRLAKADVVTGPILVDPSLFTPSIVVDRLATSDRSIFSPHELPPGIGTEFKEGRFYEQPSLSHYYYCERIEGPSTNLLLVESFQLGKLWQAEYTVLTTEAKWYIEVIDLSIIKRLKNRLANLNQRRGPHT